MKSKTLDALKGSIEKWKRIASGDGEDNGADDCPLCQLFNNDESEDVCEGCPVFERTNHVVCGGTPYDIWRKEAERPAGLMARKVTTERTKEIALEELRFLESLLPLTVNPSKD